ncbi:MAG: flagellar motor switch protein FliN [Gammaproteobacteria bacterium]|nr:flagellar motor switch protein FliN [Gammaproteobacteria bacterium]|tara:strand:+ start:555 stop:932 length:378 start_codon:yes stop_codon:yes gene_type:complete
MSEDDNKTDSESDVLLQGAESVQGDKSVDDGPFENLSLDSDLLRNIPVTISVEVGRTSLPIKALMQLTQGSVVELDRLAGEALDLLVNNTLVAQGEIVLVNERYGIRLTQIVPKSARLKLGQEAI